MQRCMHTWTHACSHICSIYYCKVCNDGLQLYQQWILHDVRSGNEKRGWVNTKLTRKRMIWFDMITYFLCQKGKHPKFRNNLYEQPKSSEWQNWNNPSAHCFLQQFARSTLADSTHRHELLMYPDSISYPAHKRSTTLSCKCSPRWEATKFRSYKSKHFHNFG